MEERYQIGEKDEMEGQRSGGRKQDETDHKVRLARPVTGRTCTADCWFEGEGGDTNGEPAAG